MALRVGEPNVVYAIPDEELSLDEIKRFRQEALSMLEMMIRDVGKNPEDYIVRDILPHVDLGFPHDEWLINYDAAYTEQKIVDLKLPEDKFIVFYGYLNLSPSPKTLYIKFFRGSIPVRIAHVERLYGYRLKRGRFYPIGFRENERMQIFMYGNATGPDRPVLLGMVAELKGETVRPGNNV